MTVADRSLRSDHRATGQEAWVARLEPRWRAPGVVVEVAHGAGAGATILTRRLLGADGMAFHEARKGSASGSWSAEKAADTYGLHYMHRGAMRTMVQRRIFVLDPTSVSLTAPGLAYRFGVPRGQLAHCSHFTFSAEALDAWGIRPPRVDGLRWVRDAAPALHLRQRLFTRALVAGARFDPLEAESLAMGLLADSLRLLAGRQAQDPDGDPRAARRAAIRAREYLLAHATTQVPLAEVGRAAGMSPFHLARVFRRVHGTSMHRYLTRLRLRFALEALLDGAESLSRVALDAGFYSHSHFSWAFRREFGRTPSAVRQADRRQRQVSARMAASVVSISSGKFITPVATRA